MINSQLIGHECKVIKRSGPPHVSTWKVCFCKRLRAVLDKLTGKKICRSSSAVLWWDRAPKKQAKTGLYKICFSWYGETVMVDSGLGYPKNSFVMLVLWFILYPCDNGPLAMTEVTSVLSWIYCDCRYDRNSWQLSVKTRAKTRVPDKTPLPWHNHSNWTTFNLYE